MLTVADLTQYIRDTISDAEVEAVTAPELARVVGDGVRDYSRLAPDVAEMSLTTVAGVTDYAVPAGVLAIQALADAAGTTQAFTVFGQTLRLAAAPASGVLTMLVSRYHAANGPGDYPTIPAEHLDYVGDLAAGTLLGRIADDIARRADVKDGLSSESWPANARTLGRRGTYLRARVAEALGTIDPFVG